MDPQKRKEQFNVAYVCAMAAQAGINPGRTEVDNDSIDMMFVGKNYPGRIRNPQIQIQFKCSARSLISGSSIKLPLKRKNYDDLRGHNVLCPRYLAILLVPSNMAEWTEHSTDGMLLRHACYWLSMRDFPDTNAQSVTVDIPLSQRLTVSELEKMMRLASDRASA